MSSGWADLSRDGRKSTPITGIGELITNDGDDGTYATLNNAALLISGTGRCGPDRVIGQ